MKTIFLLVDAMKSMYLTEDNMPFLFNFSKDNRYIKNVIPSPGFCERCEIFSGLDAFDTGNFGAIGFDPLRSPWRNHEVFLSLMNCSYTISKYLTKKMISLYRRKMKIPLSGYRIPPPSLKNFYLTEDDENCNTGYSTIFDVLDKRGLTYTMDCFTSLADLGPRTRLSPWDYINTIIDKELYFIPVYIGILDQVGHIYGEEIEKIKPYLKEVDSQIERTYNLCKKRGYQIAVLGDHGMVPVKEIIDISSIMYDKSFRFHKDFECFIDSTMLRVWFFNNDSEKHFRKIIQENLSKYGVFIDDKNYLEYRIPYDLRSSRGSRVYGDILWCAHPGILMVPDFFNKTNPTDKGMHGYIEVDKEHGVGTYLSSGSSNQKLEEVHLYSICDELCELLEIETPNNDFRSRL